MVGEGSLERQSVQRKDEGNTFLAAGQWADKYILKMEKGGRSM